MKPGDRLVCVLVTKLKNGAVFTQWPLHITLVPWFRCDVSIEQLVELLSASLEEAQPFDIEVAGEAAFGYQGRKKVSLIKQPSPLEDVEQRIRHILKQHSSWIVDESTKAKRSFRPHVTFQQDERLHEGDHFLCDRLYIVEQAGEHKRVTGTLDL